MPDDSNITISNDEDWWIIKNWYDGNPDSEERPDLQYPVDIIYDNGNVITVNSHDGMAEAKSSCIDCIELVYPVTFILLEGNTITVENNSEEGWQELKNWYEQNPNIKFEWNFQFPIDFKLENDAIITVNSMSEIEDVKQTCN